MNKTLTPKFFFLLPFFFSHHLFSQLNSINAQVWEKANPSSREATRCKDENLLNFHCGIKDKILKKYIKYSKNKSHTLSLVHASKEAEPIWENSDNGVSLGNTNYKRGKDSEKIIQKPSIFTFTGSADTERKADSLKIRFEDQNLYELIFLSKKAQLVELNKIHSYLSIKYGISLERGKYLGSDGKLIWDPKQHGEYRYRPTGLGRDDGNELYQRQSSNQADQFLAIGMSAIKRTNSENPTLIDNHNFVMWSDDNKAMSLKSEKDLDVLERNWEVTFIGSKITRSDYQVRIKKETVNPRSLPLSYWLLLKKDNGEIKRIQGNESEKYITFSNIEFLDAFDSGDKAHFTFAVSPPSDIRPGTGSQNPSGQVYTTKDLSLDLTKIALYPNPVKKDQNFTIVFPSMENLIISIYDGGGRLLVLDKVSNITKSYANHLAAQGSYLINLTQNGKIIKTFKLIVQ
ncbi:T9SS type A sorting domain-containing protein [Chryseobacterium taichungense]|uniref:T9SS type A sorting domain-containing protein n=1 Tax=Chryseobacterium taichungense TaxID=295069 RepID=UPI0028AFFCD3|nr:T9SS type A sorting domain-containing protein [Chryseobacterium taichungense]